MSFIYSQINYPFKTCIARGLHSVHIKAHDVPFLQQTNMDMQVQGWCIHVRTSWNEDVGIFSQCSTSCVIYKNNYILWIVNMAIIVSCDILWGISSQICTKQSMDISDLNNLLKISFLLSACCDSLLYISLYNPYGEHCTVFVCSKYPTACSHGCYPDIGSAPSPDSYPPFTKLRGLALARYL